MKNIAALVLCLMITVTAVSPATSPAIEGSVTPERKLSFAEKLTASPEDMLAHKRALATAAEKKASDAEKLVPTGDIKSKAAKNAQGLRKKATKARAEATKAETEGVSAGKLAKLFGNDKPQSSLSPSRGRSVSMPTSPSPEKLAGDATVPTSKPAPKEELVSDVGVASDEDSAHDSGEEGDDDSSLSDMVDDTAKSSAMKPLPMDDFMSEKDRKSVV